jgi:hypothetical protein
MTFEYSEVCLSSVFTIKIERNHTPHLVAIEKKNVYNISSPFLCEKLRRTWANSL